MSRFCLRQVSQYGALAMTTKTEPNLRVNLKSRNHQLEPYYHYHLSPIYIKSGPVRFFKN